MAAFFRTETILLIRLTPQLEFLAMTLTVLLFWIYFSLLTLVFVRL